MFYILRSMMATHAHCGGECRQTIETSVTFLLYQNSKELARKWQNLSISWDSPLYLRGGPLMIWGGGGSGREFTLRFFFPGQPTKDDYTIFPHANSRWVFSPLLPKPLPQIINGPPLSPILVLNRPFLSGPTAWRGSPTTFKHEIIGISKKWHCCV